MVTKAVILAGGLGTRISEETHLKPKPMIEIGDKPILWHIMKIYSQHGINDFIICLGYKGYLIKEYFANYYMHNSDITFDLDKNAASIHQVQSEPWKVTLIDTGDNTATGGRLKRIQEFVGDEPFCMTYGDGLCDVNIQHLIEFHHQQNNLATVTTVRPLPRFGATTIDNNKVVSFQEKPAGQGGYINGGYFVLSPKVLDYIDGDTTVWEKEPLEKLAKEHQLTAFQHDGFWQPMDTLRDKCRLEELWQKNKAAWKIW